MEVYGIIYLIRNKINGKIYIGQTNQKGGFNRRYHIMGGVGIERVYNDYEYAKSKNEHYNEHLYNSIKKYGFEAFEVIEEFDIAYSQEELDKLECMYIEIYQCRNRKYGYNNRYGGHNGKHTEEAKNKVSQSLIGKFTGENNPMYGKTHTDKTKQTISDKAKERWEDEEYRHKMSESFSNRTVSEQGRQSLSERSKKMWEDEEYRHKMSEISKARWGNEEYRHKNATSTGYHHTEEAKRKISEATKGENNPMYGKHGKDHPNSKITYCEELNRYWFSVKECVEELNLNRTSVQWACRNHKTHKGYTFKYITIEELEEIMKAS